MFEKPKFKRTETTFLFPAELQALRAGAAKRPIGAFLAVELMLDTMLRVSELCHANVADVEGPDASGRYALHVTVKGGAKGSAPMSPEVFGAARDYLAGRGALQPGDPRLANRDGQRWTRSALTQAVGRIAKQAAITRFSMSAHKLRHTSATVALAGGANPLAVSKLLGDASMRTTEQYLHLIPTALKRGSGRAAPGARGVRGARVSAWWWGLKGYLKVGIGIFALAALLKLMAAVTGWLGL